MNIRLLILYLFILISAIFPFIATTLGQVIVLLLLEVLAIFYFKMNLLNPFVWLSPFIILYNISVIILDILDIRPCTEMPTIIVSVWLSLETLFWCCLFFTTNLPLYKKNDECNHYMLDKRKGSGVRNMKFVLECILIGYIFFFFTTGYTSKMEANLYGGLAGFSFVYKLFIFVYIFYIAHINFRSSVFPLKTFLTAVLVSLAISLFIGERDVLLAVLLSTFLIYYYFYRPSKKKILFISFSILLLVPILGMFKQITNRSDLSFSSFNLVQGIFTGEFLSSGKNFEIILENAGNWEYLYGYSLIKDSFRSFFPPSICPFENSTTWFNQNFNERFYTGYGAGFSYLAEGYINFGYWGVVIWTVILAFFAIWLYRKSNKNLFTFTIYIFMIPNFIYLMRGDFSYLLSPLIKQVFVNVILVKALLAFTDTSKKYDCSLLLKK